MSELEEKNIEHQEDSTEVQIETTEVKSCEELPVEKQPTEKESCDETSCDETEKKAHCRYRLQTIFNILLGIAVIILFILHFIKPKEEKFVPKVFEGKPGSGEVLYVNLDTINENYKLIKILTDDIQAELKKQETIFSNKEAAFQKKYAQFQENYQSGVLTAIQIENAQQQLQQEYEQLELSKERVFSDLQSRQAAAITQLYDSLQVVIQQINQERNASFVLTYQTGSPFLILADPSREITDQVLFELNKRMEK